MGFPDHPLKANGISYLGRGTQPKGDDPLSLYSTHRHKDNKAMTFGIKNVADFAPGSKLFVYLSIPGVHKKIQSCAKHRDAYPDSPEFMTVYYRDQQAEERVEMDGKFGFLVPLVAGTTDPFR